MNNLYEKFNEVSDEKWYQLMVASLFNSTIEGCQFPGFPDKAFQERFTGRSGEKALFQAWKFYRRIKYYASIVGVALGKETTICDFACGWGRITRFFLKDTIDRNIYGLDVLEDAINICRDTIKGPVFDVVPRVPPYPYKNQKFDIIVVFSLFSHLSEPTARHIIQEFHRMLKPGGLVVLTSRGKVFMQHCENIRGLDAASMNGYQKHLCRCFPDLSLDQKRYDSGQFLFYQCGDGGGAFKKEVYGEAAVPYQWFEDNFQDLFSVCGVEKEDATMDMDQVLIALKKNELQSTSKEKINKINDLQSALKDKNDKINDLQSAHKRLNEKNREMWAVYETLKLNHTQLQDEHNKLCHDTMLVKSHLAILKKRNMVRLTNKMLTRIKWLKYSIAKKIGTLKQPVTFDEEWYRQKYPHVGKRKFDPYIHYLVWGWWQGHNPNDTFDVIEYLINNPDILLEGREPYAHYLANLAKGAEEKQTSSPVV